MITRYQIKNPSVGCLEETKGEAEFGDLVFYSDIKYLIENENKLKKDGLKKKEDKFLLLKGILASSPLVIVLIVFLMKECVK